jgi:exosortase
MQFPLAESRTRYWNGDFLRWTVPLILGVALWAPVLAVLWGVWKADPSLSHGPLVPLITGGLLWARRKALCEWGAACAPGLLFMGFCAALHVAAVWADIEFLKPLSLAGMTAGAAWFLGGWPRLRAVSGPLGFLTFMVPWPISVVDRLAFPLQLTSSSYAGMLGGLLGLPIVRNGVKIAVVPVAGGAPIYQVLVAKQCSGLTSLMVLLALAYLVAYFTEVRSSFRALMVAAVVPLALLANTLRITLILFAGTYWGPAPAKWVHDHEAPVLMFLCGIGLMGLRQLLLSRAESPAEAADAV